MRLHSLPLFIPALILRISLKPSVERGDLFLTISAALHQSAKSKAFTPTEGIGYLLKME